MNCKSTKAHDVRSRILNYAVLIEMKPLVGYPTEDLDFIEQIVVLVTSPEAKKDLFKKVQT